MSRIPTEADLAVEALRLADEHDNDEWIAGTRQWRKETAAELRRLSAINAQLLEALELADRHCPVNSEAEILVRAAIAAAKEGRA